MTSRDFCYWLQGYFEIMSANMPENMKPSLGGLTNHQVDMVRRHLALVFKHEIDPSAGTAEHQATLDAIHAPPVPVQRPEPSWTGGSGPSSGGGLIRC